jgi:subtilase family serine protease
MERAVTNGRLFRDRFQVIRKLINMIRKLNHTLVASASLFIALCGNAAPMQNGEHIGLSSLVAKSTIVSDMDTSQKMTVLLVFPLSNFSGAVDYAKRVSTPGDPLYGRFLSPDQFAKSYGASAADYDSAQQWARNNALTVGESNRSRTILRLSGTVGQMEALFKTAMKNYRDPNGEPFFSAATEPQIPSELVGKINGLIGLTSAVKYAPNVRIARKDVLTRTPKPETAGGTGPLGAYSASDIRTAYSIPNQFDTTRTEVAAVFEQGGFDPNDVKTYISENNLPTVPVAVRNVNGYTGAINDPGVELEAVLDIDTLIGVNPRIEKVLVYEDGDDPFAVALLASLTSMADDDTAKIISISYGTDEVIQGNDQLAAEGQVFTQLAAQGQTVVVSAGDNGAYGRLGFSLNVEDPASQPLVTSVGGTTLFTRQNEVYAAEEVWNLLGSGHGATGGGVSSYWALPSYQVVGIKLLGINPPTSNAPLPAPPPIAWLPPLQPVATGNGGSSTNRNVPDVSAVGDPTTGVAIYSALNGGWVQVGGTSLSAPIWAGYLTILDAARRTLGYGGIGFFNPALYLSGYNNFDMFDITDGTNGNAAIFGIPGFSAGPFYDNCSGLGSMRGTDFALALLLLPTSTATPPDVVRGVSGTASITTAKVSWTPSPLATGYIVQAESATNLLNFITVGSSIKLTGLSSNTVYEVWVSAVNTSGVALPPNPIFLTTH